jgi:hypothetical protein
VVREQADKKKVRSEGKDARGAYRLLQNEQLHGLLYSPESNRLIMKCRRKVCVNMGHK